MLNFGGVKELLINRKARYYEIISDGAVMSSVCKIKDDVWVALEGDIPQEIIDKIGEGIDKTLNFS